MGADLYLSKRFDANQKQYEWLFYKAVEARKEASTQEAKDKAQVDVNKYYDLMYSEGYFRDNYNNWSVLWQFGLSWWEDISPMLSKGNLTIKGCKELLKTLASREVLFEHNLDRLLYKDNIVWDWGYSDISNDNRKRDKYEPEDKLDREDAVEHYRKKYQELKDFLNKAIESKEVISCSL